ncbi:MAG: sodium:solute symporter family protein [Anaerolineales bacterium]|nr:sodium:solute symporter family protein [Anaerolineales bacterium]
MDIQPYEYASLIIAGIVVILVVRLIIGYWASRKVETTVDYVVAGRRLPLWMAGPSIMATWFAAETLMGSSASAYRFGFQGVVFDPFGAALCLILSGFLVVRLARRAEYLTLMDFYERRFGKAMSVIGAVIQIITYFGWTAAQIVAGGSILHVLLGWPLATGMILVATVVTVYTLAGGLWADTALDFLQMFLIGIGLIVITWIVVSKVGGLESFFGLAGAQYGSQPFALWPVKDEGYLGYTGTHGIFYYLAAWMAIGLGSIPAQDYLQRTCAAKDEGTAVKSTYFAAILYLLLGVLPPLLGLAAFGAIGPDLEVEQTEFVLVAMALKFLPPILVAVFIAALASALMSTSDSSMLAGATMFTENIVKVFKPDISDKTQLMLTRLSLLITGVISLLIALYAETIYRLAVLSCTAILVGMVAPYIIGMYWKKANHIGALTSMITGTISWVIMAILWYPYTLEICEGFVDDAVWDAVYISSTPAFLLSVVVLIGVSLATQKIDPPKVLTDLHGKVVDMKNPFGIGPFKK